MKMFQSIHSRLFYSYASVILFLIIFFASSFYGYTSDILENKASQSLQQLSISINDALDSEFKNMSSVANRIIASEPIKNMFYNDIDFNAIALRHKWELYSLLFTVTGSSIDYQINIMGKEGEFVEFGKTYDVYRRNPEDILSKPWITDALTLEGFPSISTPHINSWNPNGTLVISLSRSFYEVFGGKYTGIVEVQQHYNVFENIISRSVIGPNSGTKATVKTYVYNDLGQQVYPYVNPISPSNTPNYYNYVSGNLADYSTLPISTNDCKQILAFSKSANTHWTVIVCESADTLLAPVKAFRNRILVIGVIVLLITLVITYMISRQLTIPLKKIHRSISNLNLESLSTPEPFNRNTGTYELEVLNDAYVSMVSRLEQSLNDTVIAKSHEVQAQMLALQAQMNPHFLYNTITVMSIKAEKSNQPELANMCENLTHMLRYIARDSATLVTIGIETDYLLQYTALMHNRYPNEFTITIAIPSEMLTVPVPKLIIQPLVENCFKHAFNIRPPWVIEVKGECRAKTWCITVTDNGVGFDATILDTLTQKLSSNEPIVYTNNTDQIGLLNIFYRLKYHYKDATIFNLYNNLSGGATIMIGGAIEEVSSSGC